MTAYRLIYFDFDGGRGEPARIALHAAGIEFDDDRVSFQEFAERRQDLPFTCLPVLEVDGVPVAQSNAINRHVGKLAGLYPDDARQALYCDEVLDAAEELTARIVHTFGLEGDELKAARETLADGWLAVFLKGLDGLLSRGGGRYFAEGKLTMADLRVFLQVRSLKSGTLDHVPTDIVDRLAPGLAEHCSRIAEEAVVQRYYESRQ